MADSSTPKYEYRVTILWSGSEVSAPQPDHAAALGVARALSRNGTIHRVERRLIPEWEETLAFHNGEVWDAEAARG